MKNADKALITRLAALSPEAIAEQRRSLVAQLADRGWSYQRIGDALGVTKGAVGNWARR